jgi:hypothetical protein
VRLLRQTSLTFCFCIVHYLGQRYILYNWHGNTSEVYSPNLVEKLSKKSFSSISRADIVDTPQQIESY